MDKLDLIFKKQKQLQTKMKYELKWQENISINVLAAKVELTELLQETNWRPWKTIKEIDKNKLIEEYIDIIHFIINLALLLDITPSKLYNEYCKKNEINHKRQQQKY
jgi:dimeric dUTPase (all-alpha-NTP-PPase superfamily)